MNLTTAIKALRPTHDDPVPALIEATFRPAPTGQGVTYRDDADALARRIDDALTRAAAR